MTLCQYCSAIAHEDIIVDDLGNHYGGYRCPPCPSLAAALPTAAEARAQKAASHRPAMTGAYDHHKVLCATLGCQAERVKHGQYCRPCKSKQDAASVARHHAKGAKR